VWQSKQSVEMLSQEERSKQEVLESRKCFLAKVIWSKELSSLKKL